MVASEIQELCNEFIGKGCEQDHNIEAVTVVHTDPPLWEYECVTCGNVAIADHSAHEYLERAPGDRYVLWETSETPEE